MPIKLASVLEALCYEYAKLIADAAVGGRTRSAPHSRQGREYWSFATMTFRKLVAGDISPSSLLRENKLLISNEQQCEYCGARGPLQWEHLIPKSRGGPDTIDNLILSCATCNLQKGTLNPIDWYHKRGMDRRHVPRLVMGKCLKLIWEEHRRRGTLRDSEFPAGQGLSTARLFKVFEMSDVVPQSPPEVGESAPSPRTRL